MYEQEDSAFIDVRVTNPGAITRAQESVEKILEKHEREKRGYATKR